MMLLDQRLLKIEAKFKAGAIRLQHIHGAQWTVSVMSLSNDYPVEGWKVHEWYGVGGGGTAEDALANAEAAASVAATKLKKAKSK